MSADSGVLYIVATPIGNVGDMTLRAIDVLKKVDLIAAEDTRHSRPLLQQYAIQTPMQTLHDHNEAGTSERLTDQLLAGRNIALISDAGTPLVSDPGFYLVRMARKHGIQVSPVPGASALLAALATSGLPTNQFSFLGFPPRTRQARRGFFNQLVKRTGTLIFYESCHRVQACVEDLQQVFPEPRTLVIARELTKLYETITSTQLSEATTVFSQNSDQLKGEFVLVLEGAQPRDTADSDSMQDEYRRMLSILLQQCSLKTAVSLAVNLTGARKKILYPMALQLTQEND